MSANDARVPNATTIKKIAEKVRQRRESLDLDQDLARYGGPSRSTVSTLENSGRWPLRQRTRNNWAAALGWEPDAFERMARGEDPLEAGAVPTGGAAKVRQRMVAAEDAAAALDKVLEEIRAEFWERITRAANNN